MKTITVPLLRGAKFLLIFTIICGLFYTATVTSLAQLLFPRQAGGSMIEIDGKTYGSSLLAQSYTAETHLWGRIMNLDVSTFSDADGVPLLYAAPSNLSPAGEKLATLVAERVALIRTAHPDQGDAPIPVELVTCSGSGLDPHISPAAAEYQVTRLAEANSLTKAQVREIIASCTKGKFLGIFGEEVVNVLEVNLMLDGLLEK